MTLYHTRHYPIELFERCTRRCS